MQTIYFLVSCLVKHFIMSWQVIDEVHFGVGSDREFPREGSDSELYVLCP